MIVLRTLAIVAGIGILAAVAHVDDYGHGRLRLEHKCTADDRARRGRCARCACHELLSARAAPFAVPRASGR